MNDIKKRPDPQPITGAEKSLLPDIIQGDGELAIKVIKTFLPFLFIKMNDDLGIGIRIKTVSPLF